MIVQRGSASFELVEMCSLDVQVEWTNTRLKQCLVWPQNGRPSRRKIRTMPEIHSKISTMP